MTLPEVLQSIPDDLLVRTNDQRQDQMRAIRLARWLIHRGYRPTLLAIEEERRRRTTTTAQPTERNTK